MSVKLNKIIPKFKENPFLKNLMIETKRKSVEISPIGKENNILINQQTGEIAGTKIRTYRKVDDAEFVKLFTANIALNFDLKSAGIKAFNVLMFAVQNSAIQKDLIALDHYTLEEFTKLNEKSLSLSTFKRGINELIKAKIIAKNIRSNFYFINPSFCFNGNRLVFQTIVERKNNERNKSRI